LLSFLYRTRIAFRKRKLVKFFIYSIVKDSEKLDSPRRERMARLLRESSVPDIEEVEVATGSGGAARPWGPRRSCEQPEGWGER
jgi:hypothetical protein